MQPDEVSLSQKTIKNSAYSFLGYTWPIVFSIFITPVVVKKLGITDFGVYTLVNTIIGFLTLIDLGLNIALVKYISEYYAKKDFISLERLLSSARSLYAIIGFVGLGVFVVLGKYGMSAFNISGAYQAQLFPVFLLAGLTFFVNSLGWVYANCFPGLQRYDIYHKLNISQLTFLNILILVAVLMGYKLKVIFALNVLAVGALYIGYRLNIKKVLPGIKITYAWHWEEIKKSYKFGFIAAMGSLAQSALVQLDRLIIPVFTGPAVLSYYSLPGNVAQKTSGITASLAASVFPMASSLNASGEDAKNKNLYRKMVRLVTIIAAGFTVAIMAFSYKILLFWLNKDFADKGYIILIILAAVYFILALYAPLTNYLMGIGKIKFLTSWSITLAVLNLIALLLLVPYYGILGAAWAYAIGVLPIPLIFLMVERNFLKFTGIGIFYLKLYSKIVFTAAVFLLLSKFVLIPLIVNLFSLLVIGPLSVALYFVLYKVFGFVDPEDWDMLKVFLRKLKSKF